WLTAGKDLFVHTYGISYRNKNESPLFKLMETELHTVISELLAVEDETSEFWIKNFDFPDSYIAFFNWQVKCGVKLGEVPDGKRLLITGCFIKALKQIT